MNEYMYPLHNFRDHSPLWREKKKLVKMDRGKENHDGLLFVYGTLTKVVSF